jgi:hypothetical protein
MIKWHSISITAPASGRELIAKNEAKEYSNEFAVIEKPHSISCAIKFYDDVVEEEYIQHDLLSSGYTLWAYTGG